MGILQSFNKDSDGGSIIGEVATLSLCFESCGCMPQGIPFPTVGSPWNTKYRYGYLHCKVWAIVSPLFHPKTCQSWWLPWPMYDVNPLDLALASLAWLLFLRSAAVSISISHSSNFVELCSLKTAMSCSNKLVRFVCFCVVHKVFMGTDVSLSLKGSVGVGWRWWIKCYCEEVL